MASMIGKTLQGGYCKAHKAYCFRLPREFAGGPAKRQERRRKKRSERQALKSELSRV